MWIVLEGIDGCGKTTVARVLEERRGWRYGHAGPPGDGGSFPELIRTWWNCENRTRAGERWVWDRGHLGEMYCGPARRGTQLTEAAQRVFEALLIDRESEVWWLDPPADRVESEFSLEQRVAERLYLREAARRSRVPVRRFESGPHAAAHAEEMAQPLPQDVVDPGGAGTRRPRWWVLGEQCSRAALCCLPFTTHAGMQMLWPAIDPTKVRVSNALRPEDDLGRARTGKFSDECLAALEEAWGKLFEPKILCLGGTAEAACRAAGLPVSSAMRHPQYVRRFYHADVPAWISEYQEVLRG